MGYQPRFIAYATAHGRTPDEQIEQDRIDWPGGVMCGFILWMSDKWNEWRKLNGLAARDPLFDSDHASFDAWIGIK